MDQWEQLKGLYSAAVRADQYNSYEDAYLRFKRRARVDSSGVPYNVMDTDRVADGRHLMENDGRHSYGDYLDYEIRNGGRPFSPQGIADNVDAAVGAYVYQEVYGRT